MPLLRGERTRYTQRITVYSQRGSRRERRSIFEKGAYEHTQAQGDTRTHRQQTHRGCHGHGSHESLAGRIR